MYYRDNYINQYSIFSDNHHFSKETCFITPKLYAIMSHQLNVLNIFVSVWNGMWTVEQN